MSNLTKIWREVSSWPPEQRRALATRLLQSLDQEGRPVAVSKEQREALQALIGIWKTKQPSNDEQERILEEERIRKYGLMRALLDINVILDAMLQRAPWQRPPWQPMALSLTVVG